MMFDRVRFTKVGLFITYDYHFDKSIFKSAEIQATTLLIAEEISFTHLLQRMRGNWIFSWYSQIV